MNSSSSGPACHYLPGKANGQEVRAGRAGDSENDAPHPTSALTTPRLAWVEVRSQTRRGETEGLALAVMRRPGARSWASPLPCLPAPLVRQVLGSLTSWSPTLCTGWSRLTPAEETDARLSTHPLPLPSPRQVSSSFMTTPHTPELRSPPSSRLPFLPPLCLRVGPAEAPPLCRRRQGRAIPHTCRANHGTREREVTASSTAASPQPPWSLSHPYRPLKPPALGPSLHLIAKATGSFICPLIECPLGARR